MAGHEESRLSDAARVRAVRDELDEVLRRGIEQPDFAGVQAIEQYLRSGRVDQARTALGRLRETAS